MRVSDPAPCDQGARFSSCGTPSSCCCWVAQEASGLFQIAGPGAVLLPVPQLGTYYAVGSPTVLPSIEDGGEHGGQTGPPASTYLTLKPLSLASSVSLSFIMDSSV